MKTLIQQVKIANYLCQRLTQRDILMMTFYPLLNVKAIMKSKIHVSINQALMKLFQLKGFLELTNGVTKCRHIN